MDEHLSADRQAQHFLKEGACPLYIMLYNSFMPKTMNISDARKNLPALFERVTARSGEMVVIRRRDGAREAVLVSREYVDSLLAANRRLAPASDFRLLGSAEAFADIDEVLGDIRADDRKEAEARRSEVAPRRRGR